MTCCETWLNNKTQLTTQAVLNSEAEMDIVVASEPSTYNRYHQETSWALVTHKNSAPIQLPQSKIQIKNQYDASKFLDVHK